MHPRDRYKGDDDFGIEHELDLPELPIPRPSERAAGSPLPPIDTPRRIGGGASYTAAEDASEVAAPPAGPAAPTVPHAQEFPTPSPELAPAPAPAPPNTDQRFDERFTWELAAQLTAGMLANPGRVQSSVKDAMGLFAQFLSEMNGFAKIAGTFDGVGEDARRRREHGEYFHGAAPAGSYQPGSMAGAPPPPVAGEPHPVPRPEEPAA